MSRSTSSGISDEHAVENLRENVDAVFPPEAKISSSHHGYHITVPRGGRLQQLRGPKPDVRRRMRTQ